MSSVTLDKAKTIARAINAYAEKNNAVDFNSLILYVEKQTKADRSDISEVIEFLQCIQPAVEHLPIASADSNISDKVAEFVSKPMDLASEIHRNYAVARALLDIIMNRGNVPDSEEVRKTLREISRFSDGMLKMQERVYNLQTLRAFQEKVMSVLEELEPETRDDVVQRLLESDL